MTSGSDSTGVTEQRGADVRLTPPWAAPPPAAVEQVGARKVALDFFISYTSADLEVATWVEAQLHAEGYSVRFQLKDFEPGGEFQRDIDAGLFEARRVIALVSQASLDSSWCRQEWDAAGDKLLPFRIQSVDIAGLLGNRTFVDLFGPGMTEVARRQVLLDAAAGRQSAPPGRRELEASIELPPRRGRFVGREKLLTDIYQRLHEPRSTTGTRRLTLVGIAGVGKTALAVEYGQRMRESNAYEHVWFVIAEKPEALEAQLRVLVSEVQVPQSDVDLAEQVRAVLARQRDWLLVVDHAPDLDSVVGYLPTTGDGRALITSENAATWGANALEVSGWSPDEAATFLIEETGATDRTAAEALAEEFDGHPDALIQAASYIDRTGTSIARYLDVHRNRQDREDDKFAATLALAIDELGNKPLAVDVLRLGSFLAPDRIPVDLLIEALRAMGREIDELRFDREAVEPLRRFSLTRRDDSYLSFSRPVQAQVRASAEQRDDASGWIEAALDAVERLFPETRALVNPEVWPRAAELLPHLFVVVERARVAGCGLRVVGRLLSRAGTYVNEVARADLGRAGPRIDAKPTTRASLAGRATPTAIALLEDARRVLEEANGRDHLDVSEAAAELGELYRGRNQLDEAVRYLAEAHEIAERVAGADSLIAGMRLTQLARTERDAGRVSAAAKKLERAVEIAGAAEGPGDEARRVLYEALASLGVALGLQGRYREAVDHLRHSLRLQEELWGRDHIEIAITLSSLADALSGYGDAKGATEAAERKVRIERTSYGESSPARCDGLYIAACQAMDVRDVSRVEELAAEMLGLVGEDPTPDDPVLGWAYQLQASADRLKRGTAWRELLAAAGRALAAAGLPDVGPRLATIAFLVEDGETATAAVLAAELARECGNAGDWANAAQAMLAEGTARLEGGELEQAEQTLRSLIELCDQRPDLDESLAVSAQIGLGDTLLTLGQDERALEAYETGHRLAREAGRVDFEAEALLGRCDGLLAQGRHEEGLAPMREVLELRQANRMRGHDQVIAAQLMLARAESACGNEAEARAQLEAAVAATAVQSGARSAAVGDVYINVAQTLAVLGRDMEAATRAEEGLRVLQEAAAPREDVLAGRISVGSLLLDLGVTERAGELSAAALDAARAVAGERRTYARAAELAARVAIAARDLDGASAIASERLASLSEVAGMSPRLLVDSHWLLAEIAEERDDLPEALAQVEQARMPNAHGSDATPAQIALREAELNLRLEHYPKAVRLAEELLPAAERGFRLDVLRVLILAALRTGDKAKASAIVDEARALADDIPDLVQQALHRAWIADAYRELGRDEDALSLLRAASRDLQQQAVSDQPAFAGRVASAFETLAGKLTVLGDRAGEIEALERAHELCLQCADRVWLATIRNRLANATFAIGDTEASRRWLEQVKGQLPELEGDLDAAVVQVNLGLRYLDLGDLEASRDALERALVEYELTRGEDAPDVSYFLVPLIRVYAWLEDVQLASRLAERALACNLLDEHEWDSDFLDALLELARDAAGEDEHFDHLVELARTLSERRLDAAGRAEVLAQLAFFRSRFEWDDRAVDLVDAAEQELDLTEGPPALLRAELAVLRAEALVSRDDSPEAAVGMLESAAASLRDGEPEALGRVLDSLAALQVSIGADLAAAATFEELKTILDGLQRSLPDRVQVRILLAEAQLRAGKRSTGVAELRQAAYLAEAADPPVDVEAVEALCRLARALVDDADDRARALDVLELAEALNDRLYALDEPQTDALPALASTVHDIRGVEAALAIVQAALRRVPSGFGAFVALHSLVVEAGLTAESTLDLVTGSDDPDAIVTTSFILRDAFAFNRRHDDARAVLERALERLRATPAVTSPLELELLLALSELDASEDRGEARASLEAAIALARGHPDLLDRVPELEAHLGLVYADARMWDRAVAVLAAVEPSDEQRAAVEECLAIGRVITRDYERAIDDLNRLVADRAEPQLLYLLATAENATGRHQAALDSIAYAFSLGEPRPELLLLAARVCNDIAEYEAAIRYARAALELEPDDASAYSTIAWALQHLGPTRGEECEAAFQRVLDLTTDRESRIYALKGRAGARRALGREADARADYEEALAQLDRAADPWLEGWMRYNLGEFDAAKGAFERAVADSEDRISALFDLALCQAVAGAPDGSKAYRAALAKLGEREPRRQLAPLRVARNDLRDAEFVHQPLRADETFQSIVKEVDAALERTEALVVRPILPEVPAPVFDGEG